MKKEMDNSATRKIKLIARHYGKGRLVRQCISCFALLINVLPGGGTMRRLGERQE